MSGPRSIAGTVNGTQQATYTLPGGVFQFVQSIRAVIDNSGGGDTHPILSIIDATGAVIADSPQNDVIPAGESDGAATWALRLTGGAKAATPVVVTGFEAFRDGTGQLIAPGVFTRLPWIKDFGDTLLGLASVTQPTIIDPGVYAVTVYAVGFVALAPYTIGMQFRVPRAGPTFQSFTTGAVNTPGLISSIGPTVAVTKPFAAGDSIDVGVVHNSAGNVRIGLIAAVDRLS